MEDRRHYDRLRWRCRRGLLELDLILLRFLERHYPGLAPNERAVFDKLLVIPDAALLAYIQGARNPAEKELMQIIEKLRQ